MTYEYRQSETVILRRPVEVCNLEAWDARAGRWFFYTGILADWLYESRALADADVPEGAWTARSIWHEVRDEGDALLGWRREPDQRPNHGTRSGT
jgi:hypothetical protein